MAKQDGHAWPHINISKYQRINYQREQLLYMCPYVLLLNAFLFRSHYSYNYGEYLPFVNEEKVCSGQDWACPGVREDTRTHTHTHKHTHTRTHTHTHTRATLFASSACAAVTDAPSHM